MLDNWLLELTLARTEVGKEFKFISDAQKKGRQSAFFGIYGYFDVAAITIRERLRNDLFIPLNKSVRESVTFRAYPHRGSSPKDKFESFIQSGFSSCLAILVKVHDLELSKIYANNSDYSEVIRRIIETMGDETFVFFGTGHSEFLVISGGQELPKMLQNVTNLRMVKDPDHGHALFSNTTTYPLISYDSVHSAENYDILVGEVEPLVKIHCEPASEESVRSSIASWKDSKGFGANLKNIYGTQDLALTWANPLNFSDFATRLTEWRNEAVKNGVIQNTTTYLQHSP